jgi:hypothetical protein
MGGSFGVSGRRPRRRSMALVACAAIALACAGEKMVVGGERSESESVAEDAAPDIDLIAARSDVPSLEGCPASPAERRESFGCWPPPHLGRYRGFFIGAARYETLDGAGADFPTGAIVLDLGQDGRGELTFGEAGEGTERGPCAGVESPRCASLGRLVQGFAYALEDIEMFDAMHDPPFDRMAGPPRVAGEPPLDRVQSMSFMAWLGQPWQAWCADLPTPKAACPSNACADAPPTAVSAGITGLGDDRWSVCRCAGSGCRPSAPSLRLRLRMSGDGQALRGVYQPVDHAFGDALVEFTRETAP